MTERKRVQPHLLVPVAGGGHKFQIEALIRGLPGAYRYTFVVGRGTAQSALANLPDGQNVEIGVFLDYGTKSQMRRIWRLLTGFLRAGQIVASTRPDAIIGTGTAVALPLLLWGRLFGARTVLVESITRVDSLSLTTRLALRLRLAQQIYVQWPEAAALHPRLLYRGTVI